MSASATNGGHKNKRRKSTENASLNRRNIVPYKETGDGRSNGGVRIFTGKYGHKLPATFVLVKIWIPEHDLDAIPVLTATRLVSGKLAEMEPGQDFCPATRSDPIRRLSIGKQILDNEHISKSILRALSYISKPENIRLSECVPLE